MIQIVEGELRLRERRLRRLFQAMAGAGGVRVFRCGGGAGLAMGLGRVDYIGDLDKARHPSRCRNLLLNYYEKWRDIDRGREFTLERMYLHLYITGMRREERQIVALHCEPDLLRHGRHMRFKSGPHLHFDLKEYNLHRAHIALCMEDLERVCEDYKAFCTAAESCLSLLDEEVVERIVRVMGSAG